MQNRSEQRTTRGVSGGRSRSFGGCITCRSRHMKCDEGRPVCFECSNAGLQCGGYEKNIFFDFETTPESRAARFRRPLLTESERECMSEWLTSSVPPRLAHWHISQIDEECEDLPPSKEIQVSHGPFGAFRVPLNQPQDSQSSDNSESVSFPAGIEQLDDNLSLQSHDRQATLPAHLLDASPEHDVVQAAQTSEQAVISKDVQTCCGSFEQSGLTSTHTDAFQDPMLEWLPMVGEDSQQEEVMQVDEDFFLSSNSALTPRTTQLLQVDFDISQQVSHSPIMHLWDPAVDTGQVQEIFDDDISFSEASRPSIICSSLGTGSLPDFVPHFRRGISPSVNVIPQTIDNSVPHDAVYLIKHYSNTVLRFLTPFRHSKTPWHVLFIPHVKNCLAALTLDEQMEHARLCAFFSTLAISAFSLGGMHQSNMWLTQAKTYEEMGRAHAQSMLQTAYDVPKKAKYKSILMAILTMVQLYVVTGNRNQADYYLLEAEKFIRVKGLNRRKSRKVRLLHHCYAFERMFHESTFIGDLNSTHRRHVRKAIESSGAAAHSCDSLSFSLGSWSNLDQEMMKIKEREQGENDLHVQLPGLWSATLYPEIFGVPELYVFVLSLIIRLGREKDDASAQCNNATNNLSVRDFVSRAKAVERVINQLCRKDTNPIPSRQQQDKDEDTQTPDSLLTNMLAAIQHALAIYFYRRIYDLDPSMLQHKVTLVLDCLMRFETSHDPDTFYCSLRLVWPAFIAACEAEEFEVQAAFSNWFRNLARRSGLRFFEDTCEEVERVWEEKRRGQEKGRGVTWMEVLKGGGVGVGVGVEGAG